MQVNGEQQVETPGSEETATPELSLREELAKNLADLSGEADTGTDETSAAKPAVSTEVAKPEVAAPGTDKPATDTTATPPVDAPKSKAPQSWNAAEKAHWDKIPAEVQAVIARREEEAHRGITTLGQDASFGKKISEVVNPYLPMIRAEGADAASAVASLLQTAYVLRTAPAEQKVALFRQLAGQYGVDLSAAAQGVQQVDPEVQRLRSELAQVQSYLQNGQQQQHQQVETQAQSIIQAFSTDPKNEFYEDVKAVMAPLLLNGQAKDIQEAYDMACYANPTVRSTILARQTAEAETKRAAEAKAKADAKRRAGGSISGSPGVSVPTTTANANLSLRDEIRAQLRAVQSA